MSIMTTRKEKKHKPAPIPARIGNSFVGFFLRSPLRGFLGAKLLLLTVTGRRTGRTYTTPVGYVRTGDTITVLSREGRTWWRNLLQPAPVIVRVRGRQLAGIGHVVKLSEAERIEAVKDFYVRLAMGVSPEKAEETARDAVVIRIELEGGR
ncbi:MAG TPA: nitroreductase/quinone reductase family protein [Dehalococcoidia bacterium]|nr:nitroreductase/quinone reductase family protein [Dehalococcoidia bacterium]